MYRAYKLLLKVGSAELKFDPTVPVGKDSYCSMTYGGYTFQTKGKPEGDQKTPKWKDEFDLTYYQKVPLVFTLFDTDEKTGSVRTLCTGETDISKKIQSDGEVKVALKSSTSKISGSLQVNLKWIGDFELSPFRLEVVVHTVDVSLIKDYRILGDFGVKVGSGYLGRNE